MPLGAGSPCVLLAFSITLTCQVVKTGRSCWSGRKTACSLSTFTCWSLCWASHAPPGTLCCHTASQRESNASISATSPWEAMTPKACPDTLTFLCLCHSSFRWRLCIHFCKGRNYSKSRGTTMVAKASVPISRSVSLFQTEGRLLKVALPVTVG